MKYIKSIYEYINNSYFLNPAEQTFDIKYDPNSAPEYKEFSDELNNKTLGIKPKYVQSMQYYKNVNDIELLRTARIDYNSINDLQNKNNNLYTELSLRGLLNVAFTNNYKNLTTSELLLKANSFLTIKQIEKNDPALYNELRRKNILKNLNGKTIYEKTVDEWIKKAKRYSIPTDLKLNNSTTYFRLKKLNLIKKIFKPTKRFLNRMVHVIIEQNFNELSDIIDSIYKDEAEILIKYRSKFTGKSLYETIFNKARELKNKHFTS
jgi:hypothetical protein